MLVLAVDSRLANRLHITQAFHLYPGLSFYSYRSSHTDRYRVTAYSLSSLIASFVSTEPNQTLQQPEIEGNVRFRSRFVPAL